MEPTTRPITARGARTDYANDSTRAAILSFDKPKLVSELARDAAKEFNISKPLKTTPLIRELQKQGITRRLTPTLPLGRPGTVYGLTAKGRALRAHLCEERGVSSVYYQPRLDWHSYGWVACGRQKKAIICAMSKEAMRPKQILQAIKKRYRPRTQGAGAEPMGISRQNLNDILQAAVKRGIVMKEEEQRRKGRKPLTRYYLSKTGLKIKQLLTGAS